MILSLVHRRERRWACAARRKRAADADRVTGWSVDTRTLTAWRFILCAARAES